MYSDIFVRVLNISMISCYTIVVVMVLRTLILRWERKYAYLLWFVVFVNLCIPFRISGPFSLIPAWIADFDIADNNADKTDYLPNELIIDTVSVSEHHYYTPEEGKNGVPGTDSNSDAVFIQGESEGKTDYLPNEEIIVTQLPNEEITETVEHHYYVSDERRNGVSGIDSNGETGYYTSTRKMLLVVVWGIGVILLAAGNIRAVWKLHGKLKDAEPFSEEGIKTADGIETPFLWGFISPAIYLPQTIDAEECTYIIAHERYHKKRKDYIFKPLFFIIAVIHWFNPLVWAAYLLFVRDMEISCDEAVIADADEDIRKKYAESLLKYAARQNGYTLTPITFGEPSLKCRIKNVLHYKERNVIFSALILCFVLIVMAGLVVKPQQDSLSTIGMPAVDTVVSQEDISSPKEISWKSDIIQGIDGENLYTKILTESDMVSGKAVDFRTFAYDAGKDSNAYVLAGEMENDSIRGSLWLVGAETGSVQHVMQHITISDTQIESILFDDTVYGIINYQTDSGSDGRILPFTQLVLSDEIMADISGWKSIGDIEGTIISGDDTYWLNDDRTVETLGEQHAEQDAEEWFPVAAYKRGDKANHYQVGQEYELTDTEQMRLNGLVPYYGDDMDAFFDYCDMTAMIKGRARCEDAYAQIIQIGRTQGFDVYGTNLIGTMLVRTPDEKYVRIDHSFSSNYNEVPFIYEADFDADQAQELVVMGGFGIHGTGVYQEQLFIVDQGEDGVWRAYELHEDIYLPMIQQHIDSVYSEKGLELQIDGNGVGYYFAEDEVVNDTAVYAAGARILFGIGESGIIPQFASEKNRILGSKDALDKNIVLDAMLSVYSDTCVSGIEPGNHFLASLTYEGDGVWEMTEYHHEFLY